MVESPCGRKMRAPAARVDEPVFEAEIVPELSEAQQPFNAFEQPSPSPQQPVTSAASQPVPKSSCQAITRGWGRFGSRFE